MKRKIRRELIIHKKTL